MAGSLRALTRKAVDAGAATAAEIAAWGGSALRGLERYRAVLREIRASGAADLAMLSVAVRTLGELARGR
jgi:NAD-specific glutamate dehydrogenase